MGSVFSLPLDYVKTQIQRMKPDPVTGKMPYKGPWDVITKTMREHGPTRFYVGARSLACRCARALARAASSRRADAILARRVLLVTRLAAMAGLPTYTTRIAPMITLTWLIIEQIVAFEKGLGL